MYYLCYRMIVSRHDNGRGFVQVGLGRTSGIRNLNANRRCVKSCFGALSQEAVRTPLFDLLGPPTEVLVGHLGFRV